MQKIYQLLKDYNNKPLDKRFITMAHQIYLEEDNTLKQFANNLKIQESSEDKTTLGNYRIQDHLITIYIENILNKKLPTKNVNNKNILALEILKHELIHAENIKKICIGKNNIENSILKISLLDYCYQKGLYYPLKETDMKYIVFLIKENYELDPGERLTEIRAWKHIVNLLKNQRKTEELLFAKTNLYYSYTRGYTDNGIYLNCPTYEFLLELRLMREYKLIKKRVEEKNYNFDTRLEYGLPLSYNEYNNKILKKLKLKRNN